MDFSNVDLTLYNEKLLTINHEANAIGVKIYQELQLAFEVMNDCMFEGALSSPIISLEFSRQYRGTFTPKMYGLKNGTSVHGIMVNLFLPKQYRDYEVLQALLHEMVHQYQYESDSVPSNKGYHNKEFAKSMRERGLKPVSPEGKEVGFNMDDIVVDEGPFDRLARTLINDLGFGLSAMSSNLESMPNCPPPLKATSQTGQPYCGADEEEILYAIPENEPKEVTSNPLMSVIDGLVRKVTQMVEAAYKSDTLGVIEIGDGYAVENQRNLEPLISAANELLSDEPQKFRVAASLKRSTSSAKQLRGTEKDCKDALEWFIRRTTFKVLAAASDQVAGLDLMTKAASTVTSRVKFQCKGCRSNVWGKAGLRVGCLVCNQPFEAVFE